MPNKTKMLESANVRSHPLSPNITTSCNSNCQQDEEPCQHNNRRRQRRRTVLAPARLSFLLLLIFLLLHVLQPNSRYTTVYAANDDANGGGNDDAAAAAAATDDGAADEAQANDDNNNKDDANKHYQNNDDRAYGYGDDMYRIAQADAELWNWANGEGFGGISIMPISCLSFNNGHMIKFELFESETSYQCHFAKIGTWVVSIAHFMRAYFNYQALLLGRDFKLPGDAGYLNCIMLQETAYSDMPLYAKIGCVDRETLTSTRLQLHVYKDSQCSVSYDDGRSNKYHALRGYDINGYTFSTRVSFRPSFYSCDSCVPEEISGTFNKKYGTWYDDDYISQNGKANNRNNNNNDNNGNNNDNANNNQNDNANAQDDYYHNENYLAANDDVNKNGNSNNNNNNNNNNQNNDDGGKNKNNGYSFNDDYFNDDSRRQLKALSKPRQMKAQPGLLESYQQRFWDEYDRLHRKLYDNSYDIGDWNFCQRLYKYAVWCDGECRSLDVFRNDKWSKPDILLLVIMCSFFTAMLLLIVAKRLKAAEKARMYGQEQPLPGLPPLAMGVIFLVATSVIGILALFKFVNETLVFVVVICILVFIYMLRLTLFEPRRPVLLATPQHEMFDNPLDDKLVFD